MFNELHKALAALDDEIQTTRVLNRRPPPPRAPQIQLLTEWATDHPERFRRKVRVLPSVFDELVRKIQDHPIFSTQGQLPVYFQLALFLNRAGHYGNAATPEDVAEWAGVSVGTVYNCSRRVMISLISLHDEVMHWNIQDPACIEEKNKAKAWVGGRICSGWKYGYLSGDGTCFNLYQKPGHYGETFCDRKCNYSLNCQVEFFFMIWI